MNFKKHISPENSVTNEFDNHVNIKRILKLNYSELLPESFKFELVSDDGIKKELVNSNTKKSFHTVRLWQLSYSNV